MSFFNLKTANVGLLMASLFGAAQTAEASSSLHEIYDRVGTSLAVVRYTWASELGPKELSVNGIVIDASGVVMIPLAGMDERIPDGQIKNIYIVLPQPDHEPLELAADLQGRDARSMLAFVKARSPSPAFKPLAFTDAEPAVGDAIFSVGLMPKVAGYQSYLTRGSVAAIVRADHSRAVVDGNLCVVGSPVMNDDGHVIGLVNAQPTVRSSTPDGQGAAPVVEPPTFTPAHDFFASLNKLPTPDRPIALPWMGTMELAALKQEQLDYYGLTTPALQVTAIAPQSPADQAGIKPGQIIIKFNGQPIERGKTPEFTAALFRRRLQDLHPGDEVVLDVVNERNQPPSEVRLKLAPMPPLPSAAARYWADDLGFGVREATYFDFYQERLPTDGKGVLISVNKPSGAAAAGGLMPGSFVLQINGQPITDLSSFKTVYAIGRKNDPQAELLLLVRHDGREQTVRIQPPR